LPNEMQAAAAASRTGGVKRGGDHDDVIISDIFCSNPDDLT